MSETRFTPGPWKVCGEDSDWVETANGKRIASVYGGTVQGESWDFDSARANSHLIAAAPTGHALIARAVADRIDDEWLKEARAYLKAVNGAALAKAVQP